MNIMTRLGKNNLILLTSLVVFFASCKKESVSTGDISFIAVYNASPNATAIDFSIITDDNSRVKINQGLLTLGQKTTYYGVYQGTWATEVIPSSSPNTVLSRDLTLVGNEYISLFVVGPKDTLDYFTIKDDLTIRDPNRARLKFLNLAPDAGPLYLEVQVLSTITPFATRDYKTYTDYQSFDGGIIYTLTLRNAATTAVVGTPVTSQFSPGKLYTIWAKGSAKATTEAERIGIQISQMN
jgi:hypothetical protein